MGKVENPDKKVVLTDGERYIMRDHSGHYVPVFGQAMADTYTEKQAKNILQNCLARPLRKIFYIENTVAEPETKKEKKTPVAQSTKQIKQVTSKTIEQNTEKVVDSDNTKYWLDKIESLNGLIKEAEQREADLRKELVTVENQFQDILHYIEFSNLNAAQGYRVYKLLKEHRIRRRAIKNELEVLKYIRTENIGEMAKDDIVKRIETLDKRTYNPREMQELFNL